MWVFYPELSLYCYIIFKMEEKETIDQLIIRYLDGSVTKEELHRLESWALESGENLRTFREQKNLWDASLRLKLSEEEALKRMLGRINHGSKHSFWFYWQKTAAILFLPLLLGSIGYFIAEKSSSVESEVRFHEVVAAYGSVTSIELPDGSKVWLNTGSMLKYPDKFNSSNRQVYLTGEAYFEVHSDTVSPFFVQTPYFTVKATGTRFNIRSLAREDHPSVTLLEGKVQVQNFNEGDRKSASSSLKPNQLLVMDTLSGALQISDEDPYKHVAWKEGKLVFRNDPLDVVVSRINQQYNADIEIEGESLKEFRYRATFSNESLDEILRLLKLSSPIEYREIKPVIQADGSFPKRKIILSQAGL
jgi:ferric-dicitrate binding protein FerR (iron transport regulator)